jgi:hypothetical protein
MTQRRFRPICPHGDAGRPYPTWPEPGWPLGEDLKLDEALGQLEKVLTACEGTLDSAVSQLSSADVAKALRSVPLQSRSAVLRPLGLMIKPRQISQKLCQDVRTLILRADDHAARHATAALTGSVMFDLGQATFTMEKSGRLRLPDPVEKWGPALCRLALWSNGLASVRDARMWVWASQQLWFLPDGVSDEQFKDIVEAAEQVVEVSPTFANRALTRDEDSPDEAAARVVDALVPDGGPDERGHIRAVGDTGRPESPRDEDGRDTIRGVDAVTATVGEFEGGPVAQSSDPTAAPENLAAAADALDELLADGLSAAQRVLERLSAKRPPSRDDLVTLERTREAFDSVVSSLAAVGAQVAEETMVALRGAVEQIAAQAGDGGTRARLEVICGLVAPQEQAMLLTQLAQAQKETWALLALSAWNAQARERAASLGLLVELVTPNHDAASQMALVMQWSQARPDLSFLALQAQHLTLPEPGGGTAKGALDSAVPVQAQPSSPEVERQDSSAGAVTASAPARPTAEQFKQVELRPAGRTLYELAEQPPVEGSSAQPTAGPVTDARAKTEIAQVPEPTPESKPEPVSHERVRLSVAQLVSAQRLGLAAAVVERADGWTPTQQAALRVAALAGVVRHQNGAVAAALRGEFDHLDSAALASDTPSLLLTVSALLRTALVTGEPATGALLTELAARVEPNLSEVAEQVGRRALHGVLIDTQALLVLADVTEVERGMRAITSAASHVRTRHRTLRFKRATDISKIWLDPRGILGKPLSIVERNDTNAVDEVAAEIERLTTSSFVKSELDKLDRRFQGSSSKPIEGASKQNLLNLVQEALKPLTDWVEAVRSLVGRDARAEHWSAGEVADMRSAVLERRAGVLAALNGLPGQSDPLTAAAVHATTASLTGTFDILQGTRTLPVREPAPALVLTAELLKVPGVSVDSALEQVTLSDGVTVRELLAVVDRNWDEALTAQVDAENFEAAHFLLDVAAVEQLPIAHGHPAGLTQHAATVEQAERAVRSELTAEHELLATTLRHGRLNNEISDEQDGELAGLLEDARRQSTGHNLATARQALQRVAALLPEYRAEAKARLTVRLEELQRDGRVDDDTCGRITRLMDDGQLSTAEELIYFLEIDEDVPEVYQSQDLHWFFPTVPNELSRGVTRELVMLVSKRGVLDGCPVLDFSDLSPNLAEMASDALNNWRQMAQAEPAARNNISEPGQLLPALRMMGLETGGVKKLPGWPRSSDRRFIEVVVNGIIGKALVPAFGSKLEGRLRVLLAWGQPSAELLMSWADGDPSGEGLLIAHFGTMSAMTRRDLAVKAAGRSAPIIVLDDAALVYLAAHGNRQMTATMNVLLPFSSVNPYLRQKRGVVAPEMFYGRDQERRTVLDPDGTQLVFGGRGLGKSALLHSAAEQFQHQSKTVGEHVALYLDLKAVGIRPDSAINQEAIWDALLAALMRREVLTEPARSARRMSPREEVQTGVQAWLDADSQRRLLVLFDEADQFFEADMPHFLETTRLKSLGQQSNGRVKVVFAGLHSVQRYAKTARNAPFGHMAQRPTVIGPLKPQHAANLLTRPLAALGFGFEDPDLVNRILGYCSYQPFLLQIFANRLIEAMHDKRSAGALGTDAPPYMITRSDVEAVETQADLRADIRTAFHETLNLDHRYGVIAHVLAHHAHEHGLDGRLTDKQLREECLSYWHSGFAKLDVEGFRAYLQEMTGLGVLAPNNDGRGWHLRSANVLSMIGTQEDVEAQLVTADQLSVPDEFLALESRQELPGGRRSPLTAAQIDDVLGDHSNQVRVVLGSQATGVDFVGDAVRAAANVGNRFSLPAVAGRRQFAEQLVAGNAGERRVVLDDLVSVAPNEASCLEALELAQTRRPTAPGVTRSAVIVAGPGQMPLWRKVFAQSDGAGSSMLGRLPVGTVTLRRYDVATLRVWSLETNMFTSEERRAQLLRVTGGWPLLVERAAQLVKGEMSVGGSAGVDEPEALWRLKSELDTPAGAAALVAEVGLSGNEQLCRALEGVVEVIDSGSLTRAELEVAAEFAVDEPSVAVECLIALQVFDVDGDGRFVPEPLLMACWPHRS